MDNFVPKREVGDLALISSASYWQQTKTMFSLADK